MQLAKLGMELGRMSGARSIAPPSQLPPSGQLPINLDGLCPTKPIAAFRSTANQFRWVGPVAPAHYGLCAGLTVLCCCVLQSHMLLGNLRQAAVGIGGCIPAYFIYVSWPQRKQPAKLVT